MPALTRNNAKPLLRTVKNKQHATADDHHEEVELPTPPPSSWKNMTDVKSSNQTSTQELEDYTQDPLSSDDEAMQPRTTQEQKQSHLSLLNGQKNSSISNGKGAAGTGIRTSQDDHDDDNDFLFGVRQPSNSRPNGFSSQDRPAKFKHPQNPQKRVTYGSQNSRPLKKAKTDRVFQQAPAASIQPQSRKRSAVFQAARDASIFKNIDDDDLPNSSPFSTLSSPPPSSQDVSFLSEKPLLQNPASICEICQAEVDILLKQDFQDRFGDHNGKLNYARQKAFCRHHQQHEGKVIWQERGYPIIDWSELDTRLDKHHDRLRAIIHREKKSTFRDRLAEELESGKIKTNKALLKTEMESGGSGYYGPKGQQAMVKNITAHLHEDLHKAALSDPIIGSMGIKAGVTGFVQSVLIPELAVRLIMDDLNLDEDRARDMLDESRDLGEKVNPEEKNTERIEDDELQEEM